MKVRVDWDEEAGTVELEIVVNWTEGRAALASSTLTLEEARGLSENLRDVADRVERSRERGRCVRCDFYACACGCPTSYCDGEPCTYPERT